MLIQAASSSGEPHLFTGMKHDPQYRVNCPSGVFGVNHSDGPTMEDQLGIHILLVLSIKRDLAVEAYGASELNMTALRAL